MKTRDKQTYSKGEVKAILQNNAFKCTFGLYTTVNFQAEKPKDCTPKEAERRQREEQKLIDNSEALTEEELAERAELLQHGLAHWSKRDFQHFIRVNFDTLLISGEITFDVQYSYSHIFGKLSNFFSQNIVSYKKKVLPGSMR